MSNSEFIRKTGNQMTHFLQPKRMVLLPDTLNCVLRKHRECRERFPRHRLQRKPLLSDPGMHHGTCVTHVPWYMSVSLNPLWQEKMFPAFLAHAQPAILRIWQEVHDSFSTEPCSQNLNVYHWLGMPITSSAADFKKMYSWETYVFLTTKGINEKVSLAKMWSQFGMLQQ